MANSLPYVLPDRDLPEDPRHGLLARVWIPDRLCVVLGQSNAPAESLVLHHVETDRIPVYRRPSGGEAVVLSNRMVVVSLRHRGARLGPPRAMFAMVNGEIIRALGRLGIAGLSLKGISDIALGDRKVAGSSIYRNRNMVFFHAVLNVAEHPMLLGRYLLHPRREPTYRMKRPHDRFVTSLVEQGYKGGSELIRSVIAEGLRGLGAVVCDG